MPAFSGLYDGVFGEAYSALPDAKPNPPITGVLRVLLQKRGMYGMVRALGGAAPATVKGVQAARGSVEFRGGYDYANRINDAANTVTVPNVGDDVNTLEDITMPADGDAADVTLAGDTHINREYAADDANTGATAPALAEEYAV